MTISVTDSTFEKEVLKSQEPVIVDFWAEWCGPCRAMLPVVDEVAKELGDKAKIVKLNIDDSPEAPTRYGVRGVPTFMLFKDGQVVDARVGGMSRSAFSEWIKSRI